jgi:glycosyltransferase involved in cell wall biosynthesis
MAKVLFLVPHLSNSMRLLADYLRHLDVRFEVTLFSTGDDLRFDREFPADARRVIRANGLSLPRLPGTLWRLWREARRHDLVVCWAELKPTYVGAVAAWMARRPVVGWVHVHLSRIFDLKMRPGWLHRPVMRWIYPRLDAVVGCSQAVAADLAGPLGIGSAMAISNGIDLQAVRALAEAPLPEALRWVYEQPVVISVAVLMEQKNPALLLRAHARLREQGVGHRLLMVGSGPMRRELEQLAEALGVGQSVVFAGFVDNPYPLIKAARVLALASRFEGYALVLAEAKALGVAVVSTDCPAGPSEVLGHGREGRLVPMDDEAALAAAIQSMLQDEPARQALTTQALASVSRHDIRHSAQAMGRLFGDVMQKRSKATSPSHQSSDSGPRPAEVQRAS